jgi:hypothetical protein
MEVLGAKKPPRFLLRGGFLGFPLLSVRVARVVLGRDRYEGRLLPFYFAFGVFILRIGDGGFALAADGRQNESYEQEWKSALH